MVGNAEPVKEYNYRPLSKLCECQLDVNDQVSTKRLAGRRGGGRLKSEEAGREAVGILPRSCRLPTSWDVHMSSGPVVCNSGTRKVQIFLANPTSSAKVLPNIRRAKPGIHLLLFSWSVSCHSSIFFCVHERENVHACTQNLCIYWKGYMKHIHTQ